MGRKTIALILFVVAYQILSGQHYLLHPELEIDTSYTIYSALKKHQKKHPDISLAKYEPVSVIKTSKNIVYHQYGKRDMHLDIFMRETNYQQNLPCVVIIHGGGWATGAKSMLEQFALALADTGYIAISVEYRFSNEAIYPASVNDIKIALKWICKNTATYNIDTQKISIMGSSAGGQLATLVGATSHIKSFGDSLVLAKQAIKLNAIIDIDGVLAFLHPLSEEGSKPGSAAEKWFGVHFSKDSTKWVQASPLTYVDAQTPPTLFIASSYPRFQAGREDMIKILDKHKIYNETHVFNDAPHSFWLFNPWFKPTLEYIIRFLQKVNAQ